MAGLDYHWMFILITFVVGYSFIIAEHVTHINKSTIALLMAAAIWSIVFIHNSDHLEPYKEHFYEHLSHVSELIFFLIAAVTIVEIINAHRGFRFFSRYIQADTKRSMLFLTGIITFFLSSVLDNLTTTIVMVNLLKKIIYDKRDRLLLGSGIVIAANAGGAWTPIGDVTTTMLWIGGQISTEPVITRLFFPSFICLIASLLILSFSLKGKMPEESYANAEKLDEPKSKSIVCIGISCLICVPIFKMITGLPPFMGMLCGLGILWLATDLFHGRYPDRDHLRVPHILTRVDLSAPLFFLGILLSVAALDSVGILRVIATQMSLNLSSEPALAFCIGVASAVIDNVPLVAACMGMYDMAVVPPDSHLWHMLAYCAGTGGSILVIGSAAGVAFMAMEVVSFYWYLKHIAFPAFVGYTAGFLFYLQFIMT
ncbi:MAG: hypothetical protein K0S07_922 [Chlamydiales bacterium]|jgi:Na+/H+ antiporter NhaD/arsenite permease-like protein|nr:hypothetical protein [Chlamydiales bacterium]